MILLIYVWVGFTVTACSMHYLCWRYASHTWEGYDFVPEPKDVIILSFGYGILWPLCAFLVLFVIVADRI